MWNFNFCPNINETINWEAIEQAFPWFLHLATADQDPFFHAEGNVMIHTKMVAEALINLPEWKTLATLDRQVLFYSALLHDIAKPACTLIKDGRIRSPGHAKKGAQMTRTMLYREGKTPFNIRERLTALVRFHGLPLWFLEKSNPEKATLKAALSCRLSLLSLLARADALGRICTDQKELLLKNELFQSFIHEKKCAETAYAFKRPLDRLTYFKKENGLLYEPFDDTTSTVWFMCGIPGSGKDTYIQNHLKHLPVISLDAIRRRKGIKPGGNQGTVIQEAKEQARVFLRKKEDFVWNATNLTANQREMTLGLFYDYRAYIKCVYVEVPYALLLKRNKSREHPLPSAVLEKFISKFEVPNESEVHEVIYHIN